MLHLKNQIVFILTIAFVITSMSVSVAQSSGKLARANAAYDKMAYTPAIELYKSVLDELEDYEAMGKLADCFRLTNQYAEAEYWYGKVTSKSETKPEHLLYYAQVLQINEKYEEAAKWYKKYKVLVPSDARASYQIEACENYQEFFKEVDRYKIEHPEFNSPVYDFSPVYFEDGLIFSSSRDSVKSLKQTHTWTGLPFFDIYYVQEDKKDSVNAPEGGKWSKPKPLAGRLNTKYHEGPLVFTADNSKVYFTRNNFDNTRIVGKTGKSSDKIVKLKLYTAEIENGNWTNIEEFIYSNDQYSVGHAAISPDAEFLYFVSDMPGGYGGTDLYVCSNKGGKWSTPLNLGPSINTEGDEMFPYVNADETFYFSSDGHSGIGGLDIFKVSGSGTNWGKVKNLGAPINSSADDFGIVYNEEKNKGYFTSDRSGGSGSDDIYKFIDEGITLEGIIVDAKTDKPICEATSELVYLGEIIGDRVGECDGMFEYSVLPGRDYSIEGCADGYECNAVQTTTKGVKPGGKVFVKIPLIKPDPLDMEVLVIDKITKEPIPGAKVVAFNKCVKSYDDRIADANGMSYYQEVTVDCQYNVSANAESYMPADKDVLVDGTQNPVRVVIELEKIGTSPLVLRHIYYDFDQSYIREEAELDLNKVFNFMNINPGTIVEIGSHTDARASFKYNERLSERRAKAAVEWLIQRGISKDRLVAVGYGEYQLTNGCKDNVQCEEIDHQKNRRTEFRVLDNVLGIDVKSIERNNMLVDPCLKCPF